VPQQLEETGEKKAALRAASGSILAEPPKTTLPIYLARPDELEPPTT
jgi:hypothetical protein